MSTLLLFLPPRTRLHAPGRAMAVEPPRAGAAREYDWALSPDGHHISREGRSAAAALPAADSVIAIVADADLSWRCVDLPRAGRQMRAALAGKLEDVLLDDPETVHFALEPEAGGGDSAWVAITSRTWLAEHLAHLDTAQLFVERVAPLSWPGEQPRGHFSESHGVGSDGVTLRWSHSDGVASLPLQGGLGRQFFNAGLVQAAHWTATPGIATTAERWLGSSVGVLTPAQRALDVIDNGWNLRQFDLAPRARGVQALRMLGRTLTRKAWQPVRWGLAGLVVVQLLGLNLWAWHQNRELSERRQALSTTLTTTFPQVRAVMDAPVQMQKQLDLLRINAGSVGEQDLEALLGAAALAWPGDRPPAEALAFEPGRLTVSAAGWNPAQVDNFRNQLQSEGWQLDASEGKLTISRASDQGRR